MMMSLSTPMTESTGPVMPRSVMYAVPPGRTRSSAVCTWRCVPTTALTRPSRYQPSAIFSEVASACMSTTTTGVSRRSSATTSSALRNGQSIGCMNTRPIRLSTPTRYGPALTVMKPDPGVPGREVRRTQEEILLADVRDDLFLVPDVIAGGQHVDPALREHRAGDLGGDAEAPGGVLDVHDRDVDRVALAEAGQELGEGRAPGVAEDVAHHHDVHRVASDCSDFVAVLTSPLRRPGSPG